MTSLFHFFADFSQCADALLYIPLCECLSVKPEQVDPQPPEASVVQIPQLLHFLNNGWIVVVVRIGIVP